MISRHVRVLSEGITAICAGAAGVDTPSRSGACTGWRRPRFPGAAFRIVHDTALIPAAADVDHGVALISGTGSVPRRPAADGRRRPPRFWAAQSRLGGSLIGTDRWAAGLTDARSARAMHSALNNGGREPIDGTCPRAHR